MTEVVPGEPMTEVFAQGPSAKAGVRPVSVTLQATDELTSAGLAAMLAGRPDVRVVAGGTGDVLVFAAHRLDNRTTPLLRGLAKLASRPVVLLLDDIAESQLLLAVECNAQAILPRSSLTEELLVSAITAAAAGEGMLPPSLVGGLIKNVRSLLDEAGLNAAGLNAREVEVARLLANGLENAEVAAEIGLSERTVKAVVQTVTRRLGLRNRTHVVAHAMRFGLI